MARSRVAGFGNPRSNGCDRPDTRFMPLLSDGCAERQGGLRVGITATTMAKEVADLFFYENLEDVILAGTSSGGVVISKAVELAREKIRRLV